MTLISIKDILQRCEAREQAERENYGIGPMIIHDLPIVRAWNARMRQEIIDREEAESLARAVADLADEMAGVR